MKRYILLALSVCQSLVVLAAEAPRKSTDANLFGHVVDRETHEHIPYASVAVVGTAFGTTTDASGHYFLKNLPVGELTLEVRALGYASGRMTVALERGETRELNFEVAQSGISMDEVVVSASRSETLRREAPALVSVLNAGLFERANASCLAQGLSFQPGVRVEDDCQNCGFTQVRINGLDGHYSQILVDSHPVFSSLTGVYGLEQIPANMIERVEVLRGGGSALYGSSAIGGTINIITREPTRSSAQLSHTLTSLGGSNSYDNNTMLNASIVSESGRAGISVFGQSRHRSGYDHDGDGFTELPVISSQSVGMRSFFRTGAYSRITAQYHHIDEYRRGGDLLKQSGHFGLAAKYYCHFTSPIRRYPDLQIHRIIKDNLRGRLMREGRTEHYAEILDEVARQSSVCERRADEAERESDKLKKAEYMSYHLGEEFEGIISGVTGWGLYVELPNTVEGLVHVNTLRDDYYVFDQESYELRGEMTKKVYKLGDKVRVRVAEADKMLKTVDFELVSDIRDDEEEN